MYFGVRFQLPGTAEFSALPLPQGALLLLKFKVWVRPTPPKSGNNLPKNGYTQMGATKFAAGVQEISRSSVVPTCGDDSLC